MPVPGWAGAYVSEPRAPAVTPGPAARAASTSRSMMRPCGPVPTPADCTEMPAALAAALARGDAGASSPVMATGAAAETIGGDGATGAAAAPVAMTGEVAPASP